MGGGRHPLWVPQEGWGGLAPSYSIYFSSAAAGDRGHTVGGENQDTCLAEVWAGPNSLRWLHMAGGQEGVCFWLRWATGPVSR